MKIEVMSFTRTFYRLILSHVEWKIYENLKLRQDRVIVLHKIGKIRHVYVFLPMFSRSQITSTIFPASSTARRCVIADTGRPIFALPPAPTPWKRSSGVLRGRFFARWHAKSPEVTSNRILQIYNTDDGTFNPYMVFEISERNQS